MDGAGEIDIAGSHSTRFLYETMYCLKQMIKLAYRTNLNNAPIVVLIDAHDIYKIVNHHALSCE